MKLFKVTPVSGLVPFFVKHLDEMQTEVFLKELVRNGGAETDVFVTEVIATTHQK